MAIVGEVLAFDMPGAGIPGYLRKAAQMAHAGIFDLRVHHDEVLMPISSTGASSSWRPRRGGRAARDKLAAYLVELDASARRFEERRAAVESRKG